MKVLSLNQMQTSGGYCGLTDAQVAGYQSMWDGFSLLGLAGSMIYADNYGSFNYWMLYTVCPSLDDPDGDSVINLDPVNTDDNDGAIRVMI